MHRPVNAKLNPETGLVDLKFVQDEICKEKNQECPVCQTLEELKKEFFPQHSLTLPHVVRGAVVWPLGMNPGYVLVSAQEVESPTKEIKVYGERPFWSVGNMDMEKGIWSFFQEAREKYHCCHYFYSDQKEHRRYFIQVQRETLLLSQDLILISYFPVLQHFRKE